MADERGIEPPEPFMGDQLLSRQPPGTDAGRLIRKMVVRVGIEPTTPAPSTQCSTELSYLTKMVGRGRFELPMSEDPRLQRGATLQRQPPTPSVVIHV